MRVHTNDGRAGALGGWLVRFGEIRGLTPQQIADKLNLQHIPTHITEVFVPKNTSLSRGMTNLNLWEGVVTHTLKGQVQYKLEERILADFYRNTRIIGEHL